MRVIHSGDTPACGAVPPGLIDLFWCAGTRDTPHVRDAAADRCDFPIHLMPDNMAVQPLLEPRQIRAVLGVKRIRIAIAAQIAVDPVIWIAVSSPRQLIGGFARSSVPTP